MAHSMEQYDPSLIFKMRLPVKAQKELIVGRLYLRYNVKVQYEYKAVSGLAGKQFLATQGLKGIGPLPSSKLIRPERYIVSTNAHSMIAPGHKGAKFYPISPSIVRIGNVDRGDFGIHQDLSLPGTIGCIGIPDRFEWILFMENMDHRRKQGHLTLPLEVVYY